MVRGTTRSDGRRFIRPAGLYRDVSTKVVPMPDAILQSIITCPCCGRTETETMSMDACQYFYD